MFIAHDYELRDICECIKVSVYGQGIYIGMDCVRFCGVMR